jgi:hypothetical protein
MVCITGCCEWHETCNFKVVCKQFLCVVQQVRGLLVMTPEWKMSLKLKYIESHRQQGVEAVREHLHAIDSMAMRIIIDESDNALDHR